MLFSNHSIWLPVKISQTLTLYLMENNQNGNGQNDQMPGPEFWRHWLAVA
jgi:hypothetical protein